MMLNVSVTAGPLFSSGRQSSRSSRSPLVPHFPFLQHTCPAPGSRTAQSNCSSQVFIAQILQNPLPSAGLCFLCLFTRTSARRIGTGESVLQSLVGRDGTSELSAIGCLVSSWIPVQTSLHSLSSDLNRKQCSVFCV